MIKSFRTKPQHPLVELRNHILRLRKNQSPHHGKPSRLSQRNTKPLQVPALRGERYG